MTAIQQTYIICATQRSGSTLLCSFLSNLRIAGQPGEFLLPEREPESPFSTENYADYVHQLLVHFATSNGVSGVKIMNNTWEYILERLREQPEFGKLSEAEIVKLLFPNVKFIFMIRRNKFRQAISLSRAEKSRVWEKHNQISKKQSSIQTELHPFYLKSALKRVHEREQAWIDFFKRNDIQPLEMEYETLVKSYQTIIPGVLDFIGIEYPTDLKVEQNKLKKQADMYTEFLIMYYRVYFLLYNFLPESVFGYLRWLKHKLITS